MHRYDQQERKLNNVRQANRILQEMGASGTLVNYEYVLAIVKNPRVAAQVMSVHLGHNNFSNVLFSQD